MFAVRSCVWASSILFILTACVEAPYSLPPPPNEKLRATFGTLGVAGAKFPPKQEITIPAKGADEGAGRGAAQGALGSIAGGAQAGGIGVILGIILAPVFAVGGAGAGAASALPEETVTGAETVINESILSLDIQNALRDRVTRAMKSDAELPIVTLLEHGPTEGNLTPSYQDVRMGVGAVLEVSVTRLVLEGPPLAINPLLRFVMSAKSRLVEPSTGSVLYSQNLTFNGELYEFLDWAKDSALEFKTQFKDAVDALSEKITDDIFLLYLPPKGELKSFGMRKSDKR